ncbi:MAG: UDP binding domain-containing protein, partial [Candidatus Sericytochromatia bacterium]
SEFLRAGIGYGGSCFPKDVSGFVKIVEDFGYEFNLLRAVQEINLHQRARFVEKVRDALEGQLEHRHLAVLGLSFKPNTDDIREAPSLDILEALLAAGATISVYDPVAMKNVNALLGDRVDYAKDPYQACHNADAALFLTEWQEFAFLNLPRLKQELRQPVVIDGRNIFDPLKMRQLGFRYASMGQSDAAAPFSRLE